MGHQLVYVILPAETEDLRRAVNRLLEPHSLGYRLEPWKRYFDPFDIVNPEDVGANPKNLLSLLREELGEGAEQDEKGYFTWCDTNAEEGHFDYWVIGGFWNGILAEYADRSDPESRGQNDGRDWGGTIHYDRLNGNVCRVSALSESSGQVPFGAVEPDGQYHALGFDHDERPGRDEEWSAELRSLYVKYRDHLIVAVDTHL
jgi:hypothetical protein